MAIDYEKEMVGTVDVPDADKLDEAALTAWFESNVEDFTGPLSLAKFKGGQSNPTYKLFTPTKQYVMRRKPPGKLLPSAHAVDREFKVINALYPTGFPVARPYGLCMDEDVIGTIFYVMDNVDGRILWDQTLPDYEPAERRKIYEAKVKTFADLHNTDYKAVGLQDFGAEMFGYLRQCRPAGLDHPAGGLVGVHQVHTLLDEVLCNRALAAADTAGKAQNPGLHDRIRLSKQYIGREL